MNRMQFLKTLNSIIPSDDSYLIELGKLADQTSHLDVRDGISTSVFQYLEKYPDLDFGSPGPLVHFLESSYTCYISDLLESVHRRPVPLTIGR